MTSRPVSQREKTPNRAARKAAVTVQKTAGAGSESQFVTQEFLKELEQEMLTAAELLDFERAAKLRDKILQLKNQVGQMAQVDDESPGFTTGKNAKSGRKKSRRDSAENGRRGERIAVCDAGVPQGTRTGNVDRRGTTRLRTSRQTAG